MNLPDGWTNVEVGEVVSLVNGDRGKNYPSKADRLPSGVPFVSAGDLKESRIDSSGVDFIAPEHHQRLRSGHIQAGDTVLCIRGSLGNCAFATAADEPGAISSSLVLLRPDLGRADPRFIYSWVASPKTQAVISSLDNGAAQPNVGAGEIAKIRMSLPPLATQRSISIVLGAFSDLIETNRRRIEILEEMARLLYREWFVNFRFPGHENVERVESELGEIPKGWEIRTLDDTCEHMKRNLTPHKFEGEEFLHYSIPAFDADRLPSLEHGEEIRSGKYEMVEDCVLLSKLNPRFPRVWRSKGPYSHRAVCSTEFLVLESSPGGWPLDYLQCFVQNSDLGARLAQMAGGTSTSHQRVKPDDVMALPIVAPPNDLVTAFSERLQPINDLVLNLIDQNQALREARDLLLPRLVSGELDVSELGLDAVVGSVV